jgi:hypothetical protein
VKFKVGDRVVWSRAGHLDKGRVLEVGELYLSARWDSDGKVEVVDLKECKRLRPKKKPADKLNRRRWSIQHSLMYGNIAFGDNPALDEKVSAVELLPGDFLVTEADLAAAWKAAISGVIHPCDYAAALKDLNQALRERAHGL